MLPENFRLHLFVWFWVILSFILFAFLLIIKASGYVVNLKAKILQPTGMIIVSSQPKGANLYLNEQLFGQTPIQIKGLYPGIYRLRLQSEKYQEWTKTIRLKPGQLITERPVLFLKEPKIEEPTLAELNAVLPLFTRKEKSEENMKAKLPQEATDFAWNEKHDALLYRKGSEIRIFFTKGNQEENHIVARFIDEVQKVAWYPDFRHILFVLHNELRVIEIDGTNDTKLLSFSSPNFVVLGEAIYLKEGQRIKKIKVQ